MNYESAEEMHGHTRFLGHTFYYPKDQVFTPLSISERAVTHILNDPQLEPKTILDMGCGCGCIGLVLAETYKDSQVTFIDNSDAAIYSTEKNLLGYSVFNKTIIQGDIFIDFAHSAVISDKFDLIIANLPYLSSNDYLDATKRKALLPQGAYDATGNCFRAYFKLINYLDDHLNYGGTLYLILPPGGFVHYIESMLHVSGFDNLEYVDTEMIGKEGLIIRVTKESACEGNDIYDRIQAGELTPASLSEQQIIEVAPVYAKKIKRGATTLANLPENLKEAIIDSL